jgi:PAS domain S-box-containing protein
VNQKWCDFAGITQEEAQGSTWPVALYPEDQERVSAEWRAAVDAGREFASEFRFSTPQGDLTWLFAVALAMHDDNGRITGYLGTITDITKLKQAERALRESEERFRFLYDYNPSMYFTLDLDGRVLSVNQYGADQLGYTVSELVGASVFDVFHPDDRASVQEQLALCGSCPGEIARWEYRKIRKDGRTIWVHEAARAVLGPNGQTVVLIVCEDVTDKRGTTE